MLRTLSMMVRSVVLDFPHQLLKSVIKHWLMLSIVKMNVITLMMIQIVPISVLIVVKTNVVTLQLIKHSIVTLKQSLLINLVVIS